MENISVKILFLGVLYLSLACSHQKNSPKIDKSKLVFFFAGKDTIPIYNYDASATLDLYSYRQEFEARILHSDLLLAITTLQGQKVGIVNFDTLLVMAHWKEGTFQKIYQENAWRLNWQLKKIDLNCDGFLDLFLSCKCASTNPMTKAFLFNPQTKQLERNDNFDFENPIIDTKRKLIIDWHYAHSTCWVSRERIFKIVGNSVVFQQSVNLQGCLGGGTKNMWQLSWERNEQGKIKKTSQMFDTWEKVNFDAQLQDTTKKWLQAQEFASKK